MAQVVQPELLSDLRRSHCIWQVLEGQLCSGAHVASEVLIMSALDQPTPMFTKIVPACWRRPTAQHRASRLRSTFC